MTLPSLSFTRTLALVMLMVAAAPARAQVPVAQAAAPQAASLPQVSPIDQFALSGPYLFVPRGDSGRTLNEQPTGGIELAPFQAGAQTAQWVFEAVPGTPFVRIKNRAQNTYLAGVNGALQALPASPDDGQAQWTFEPVDGTPFVQLRNRESDHFLFS
jgi:hypothetical protein